MKKALITGVTGQDGSYMTELLLSKGYEVHGIIRRVAVEDSRSRMSRLSKSILNDMHLHIADLTSYDSIYAAVEKVRPDECYHFAAQSFVTDSFTDPFSTMDININGTHRLLKALQLLAPKCKVYFAASSEMFGNTINDFQDEITPFNPRSPYGVSKVTGYYLSKVYRDQYKMFISCGITFNHESERRGFEFVTRKISRKAAEIALGLDKELRLGNLEAARDWGYAPDYVQAFYSMLQYDKPDDFVIATGETHTIKEFVEEAFKILELNWEDYVKVDPAFLRPLDIHFLCGDSKKFRDKLNWEPTVVFKDLVRRMVTHDFQELQAFKGKL